MRIVIIIAIILLIAIAVLAILLLSGVLFKTQTISQIAGTLPDKDCNTTDDCSFGTCIGGKCLAPIGMGCLEPSECQSGICTSGICTLPLGGVCTNDADCSTGNCDSGICKLDGAGAKCQTTSDCSSNLVCSIGACSTQIGDPCITNNQCETRSCVSGICSQYKQIYELAGGTDIMYSPDPNEADAIFDPTGTIVPLYPKEATDLIPVNRCYYPSINVHSVGLNRKCPNKSVFGLTDPVVEFNLGYARATGTGTVYKTCIDGNSNTFIRQTSCQSGEEESETYTI